MGFFYIRGCQVLGDCIRAVDAEGRGMVHIRFLRRSLENHFCRAGALESSRAPSKLAFLRREQAAATHLDKKNPKNCMGMRLGAIGRWDGGFRANQKEIDLVNRDLLLCTGEGRILRTYALMNQTFRGF